MKSTPTLLYWILFAAFIFICGGIYYEEDTEEKQTYAFFKEVEGGYKTLSQVEFKPSQLDKIVSFLIGSEDKDAKMQLSPLNPYLELDAEVNKVEFSVWRKVR